MLLYCKFIGTLKKILVWCLLSVLAIQVAGYIALQFPAVQTFVIQRIIDAASKQIDGKIGIGTKINYDSEKMILKTNIGLRGAEQFTYCISSKQTKKSFFSKVFK